MAFRRLSQNPPTSRGVGYISFPTSPRLCIKITSFPKMDPLSIASAVSGLTGAFLTTAKKISDVLDKFKGAPQSLQAIHTETKSITLCLSQLQNILLGNENPLPWNALLSREVLMVLDAALTGCATTLSCIEEELRKLFTKLETGREIGIVGKISIVWKDEGIKDLLLQLRGQSAAINLVFQGLQMSPPSLFLTNDYM